MRVIAAIYNKARDTARGGAGAPRPQTVTRRGDGRENGSTIGQAGDPADEADARAARSLACATSDSCRIASSDHQELIIREVDFAVLRLSCPPVLREIDNAHAFQTVHRDLRSLERLDRGAHRRRPGGGG
jgi:hypothetical protein